MNAEVPKGSLPAAEPVDFMCTDDTPGFVHIRVGWNRRVKLDQGAAESLLRFLESTIRDTPKPRVLLNLEDVGYLNSAAVGVIVAKMTKRVWEKEGRLIIYKPDPWVKKVLLFLKLEQIMPIVDDLSELG